MDISLLTRAQAGNRKARAAIIQELTGLAYRESRHWRKLDPKEAKAVAWLALVQAVDASLRSFDPERQSGITAYVLRCIRLALSRAHETRHAISATRNMQAQFRAACAGQSIPARTRRTLALSMPRVVVSLDARATPCADDNEPRTVGDLIPHPHAESPERLAADAEQRAVLKDLLLGAIDTPRDRLALSLLFGLDSGDPLDQRQVSVQTGLTLPQISGIRAAAYKRWRQIPQLQNLLLSLVTPS